MILVVRDKGTAALEMAVFGFSGPGTEWGDAKNFAVQDNYTQFGDQITSGFSGSELDELYMRTDGNNLFIGVTGNLEENDESRDRD